MSTLNGRRHTGTVVGMSSGKHGKAGRKGYRNKSHQLETIVRDKVNFLAKLQSEKQVLQQKGAVLELLLEVASEVAVHKRKHNGTKFPELRDAQLLEFLERFLDNYGGYGAERPTAHNYFQLDRIDVEKYREVQNESFRAEYTALVKSLGLLLLQATDDGSKGGLLSTIDDLKQLLMGTLLWSPMMLMEVSTQNLADGAPLMQDPEKDHSKDVMLTEIISGIKLSAEQEDLLVIIGELYNSQVAALEATHATLCQQLDTDLANNNGSGALAATIMRVNSNMHRLLAIHQLFHVAIMHHLLDQQLAHMCVRSFPRFPCMQGLLTVLARIREQRGKGGLDVPEAAEGARGASLLPNASTLLDKKQLQKPSHVEPSYLSKGRGSEGSKLISYGNGVLSSSVAASLGLLKDELADAEQARDATPAAASVAAAPAEAAGSQSQDADALRSSAKDGMTQSGVQEEPRSSTPMRPDSSPAAPPNSSYKRARSPVPAAPAGSTKERSSTSSKISKKLGGAVAAAAAAAYAGAPPQKRSKLSADEKWTKQLSALDDGADDMAAVAAAAAAGMPLDPAAAAALPVPLDNLPTQQRTSGSGQQGSSLWQQITSALASVGGQVDVMQLVASNPKLALLLQQQPQLLGMLQEAAAQQQDQQQLFSEQGDQWQQQQHNHQLGLPELLQAVAAGSGGAAAYAMLGSQQQEQGFAPAGHTDSLQQQKQWAASQGPYGAGGGRAAAVPTLEMLPPSLMAKDNAAASTPLQALLRHVGTVMQACSSVSEAATAAAEAGQEDFVLTYVSAAEGALGTALKSLQDIKARCSRPHPGVSGAPAAAAGGGGYGGLSSASGPMLGLPPAGPSSSRLQPPAGIPAPGPGLGPHAAQAVLPQSLSLALTGVKSTEGQGPQVLPGMGGLQGGRRAAHNRTSSAAGQGGRLLHEQQQQVLPASLMQQLASLSDNPAALAQLVQFLQQQQPNVDMSALLVQVVGAAGQGAHMDIANLAAVLQQQSHQATGHAAATLQPQNASTAMGARAAAAAAPKAAPAPTPAAAAAGWANGQKREGGYAGYDLAPQQHQHQQAGNIPPEAAATQVHATGKREVQHQHQQHAAAADKPAGAAAATPAAAAAAGRAGATEVKEESPSAGSSTTITGQSGRQPTGTDSGVDQGPLPSQPPQQGQQQQHNLGEQQQKQDQQRFDHQQQLEGLARAAAAAMGSQLQGPGQAEAFISTVMQLLQGQGGIDLGAAGVSSAMADLLSAMNASTEQGHSSALAPAAVPHPSAALAAPAPAAPPPRLVGQSPAAAATLIPPAAAAAMAAKRAAAAPPVAPAVHAAAAGSGLHHVDGEFGEGEVDAVSALEMLAAAAVHSQQQQEVPQPRRRGGPR